MLLNFWASWCMPSIKYSKEILDIPMEVREKVKIVSISVDSDVAKA
jgi:hypothetical protein